MDRWGATPVLVSVGLFVSDAAAPVSESVSEDAENIHDPQDASSVDPASIEPSGHVVIVYSQAKEKAIETLVAKEPLQIYWY